MITFIEDLPNEDDICPNCGGEGVVENCFEDTCVCLDPPCLLARCDWCRPRTAGKLTRWFGVDKVVAEIAAERRRQIKVEGWTAEHDDQHDCGELAFAAACYAQTAAIRQCNDEHIAPGDHGSPSGWPFEADAWKPRNSRDELIRAAALIVAEIERLDRAERKALTQAPEAPSPPADAPGKAQVGGEGAG
jgi:hypothetical protein